jgi:D-beta-D-heptose 7-phosphate kinase / D-beta-D-heptose 1-phosphate adenosyltransferase
MYRLLQAFESIHVLVVGDIILDRYWFGTTSRISPEAPVPVVRIETTEDRPGGAGNVAMNVTSLGARATLIGVTGTDEAAERLACQLQARGVQCYFRRVSGFTTVTKLRILSQHQQLIRLDFEDGFQGLDPYNLLEDHRTHLDRAAIVVLSDYAKGSLVDVKHLIEIARAAGKPVIVDPKGQDFSRYRGATVVTPNLKEFQAVVGACNEEDSLVDKAQRLAQELGLEALLITRGEQGMTLVPQGQEAVHLPARAREVYDVTGAGDTVVAVLATSLAAGYNLAQAMALANTAAGLVVAKLGAATVSVNELETAMQGDLDQEPAILDEESLVRRVQSARRRGETIVMTNGCFDVLHAGHVHYLEGARKRGDRLIVAINDDASVQRLKGERRPINSLEHRMAVLAGLKSVDWVVPFSEDTPKRLICRIVPDVLVKGGDYKPDQIAGQECVIAAGGQVITLPYVPGCSSSRIIAAAVNPIPGNSFRA